jgi:transcriptional regulator with XRE-family HTH domain
MWYNVTMARDLVTWLNEQLDERGWSFSELARRADLNSSTVSLVLSEQRNPGFEFCVKIAEALGERYPFVLELAGLVPESPPHVHEEEETIEILRSADPVTRQTILTIIRAYKNSTSTPNNITPNDEDSNEHNSNSYEEAARRVYQQEYAELLRQVVVERYNFMVEHGIATQEDQGETIPRLAGEWMVEEKEREKGECQ